jgi:hypothetical protein
MDLDDDRGAASADTYSHLSDAQLRCAIRFAQAHLRSVEEDHEALRRAYRDEMAAMQSHLVDRLLTRIISRHRPLSEHQRRELQHRFERRATPAAEIISLVRAASRGRSDQIDELSEIEALAILMHVGPVL